VTRPTEARLIFLEDRPQVEALEWPEAGTSAVALTAEALEAAEDRGIACTPVSRFGDARELALEERRVTRELIELLRDLESFITSRHGSAPAGFLTQQAYHVQISIAEIATRAYLMRETIRSLQPDRVAVLERTSDPWFWPDADAEAPWVTALDGVRAVEGFELERLSRPRTSVLPDGPRSRVLGSVCRGGRAFVRRRLNRLPPGRRPAPDALRLLFVPYPGYDWAPVARRLRGRARCFDVDLAPLVGAPDWTFSLGNQVRERQSSSSTQLGPEFEPAATEAGLFASLVDEWAAQTQSRRFEVHGIDLLPALVPHLRVVAWVSAGNARHADAIAERALDAVRPHAVCFFAIPWLATKRVADVCRRRSVAVVSYQHGGAYGTHDWVPQQLTDWADADYFLSYGEGIEPPAEPVVPQKALFVPVGSARLASWSSRRLHRPGRRHRVLWIAELASRNVFYWLVEDTKRYLLERRCLEVLGSAGVDVIYRPYAADDAGGLARWLRRSGPRSVRIASRKAPIASLIEKSEIVITDTSSGTVWNEVLALGKPLVLYCEPSTIQPLPDFANALAEACTWCRSEDELVHAVERIASGRGPEAADPERFLRRYVLGDGDPVGRVISFLEETVA
jgi:hypothetical protein